MDGCKTLFPWFYHWLASRSSASEASVSAIAWATTLMVRALFAIPPKRLGEPVPEYSLLHHIGPVQDHAVFLRQTAPPSRRNMYRTRPTAAGRLLRRVGSILPH